MNAFRACLLILIGLVQWGCWSKPPSLQAPAPTPFPTPKPGSPYFLVLPSDQRVRVGQTATFTCLAAGSGSLSYQWYLNGLPIQGAQSTTYTLSSTTLDEDGSFYSVAVSNAQGWAQSPQARLLVRIWLADLAVTGIQAALPDGPALLPGASSPLVVTAALASGAPLTTEGRGGGKVGWDNFTFLPDGVAVDAAGTVSLPEDPRLSDGVVPHLRVAVVDRPDLSADLDIPVRYDGAFRVDASGAPGTPGTPGSDGFSGLPGSPGSCDSENPQVGGDGSNGGSGGNGGMGGDGMRGGDIQAWVRLRSEPAPLLEVKVVAQTLVRYVLVDPQGGSLLLVCDGGAGGDGGRGGRGGAGGSGGFGCPNGSDGSAGSDGSNGPDGTGGSGGRITVWVDPAASPYLSALRFSNKGGLPFGQDGPPPLVQITSVAPLW